MTQLSLLPQTKSELEKQRKQLLSTIKKRRGVLRKVVVRNEMLKVQLEMLKREYMVKIGNLVLKDNQLDVDIMRLRNIVTLMEEGKTLADATLAIEKEFYAEQLELELEKEHIQEAEKMLEKNMSQKSEEVQATLKELWRKLISNFHPDLTQDPLEKKRRDEIMRQINVAYEEADLSRLMKIEREQTVIEETTLEGLEEVLVKIENEIIEQELRFDELKQSEWYVWNMKIRKSKQTITDIFSGTEKKLLNDIVSKLDIIKELKRNVANIAKEEPELML